MYICIYFHRGDQIKTKIVNFISSDQKFVNYLGETNFKLRTSLLVWCAGSWPSTQEGREFRRPAILCCIVRWLLTGKGALFHWTIKMRSTEETAFLPGCFCVPPFDCHHLSPSFVAQHHARGLSHQSHPNDRATAEMSVPPLPAKPHGPNVLVTSTVVYKVICHHVSKGSVFAWEG